MDTETPLLQVEGARTRTAASEATPELPVHPPSADVNPLPLVVDSTLLGAPACSSSEDEVMEDLEDRLCTPMQTPLIRGKPRRRRTCTPVHAQSMRRSVRIAATPREDNATKQAQAVLKWKLGVAPPAASPDPDVVRDYMSAFRQPLSEASHEALQLLLGGDFDLVAMNLNMLGLDDQAL